MLKHKKIPALLFFGLLLIAIGFALGQNYKSEKSILPSPIRERVRALDKYTYANLSSRSWQPTEIKIESSLDSKSSSVKPPYKFKSYLFSTTVEGKKVTGQINIPNNLASHPDPATAGEGSPVILMFRGWAPLEGYQTGTGTKNSAAVLSQNGFITVAPDFFGYGGSDPRSNNEMEARFESYIIALQLLYNLSHSSSIGNWKLDIRNLFIWGHSNGGHLAIATLEMANHSPSFVGQTFPTVLWAPVSKPFPYSIVVYQDEAGDLGKGQRKSLSNFETDYDVNLYSIHNYLDWIQSPIQLHQGTADEEVPYWWSRDFASDLKSRKKDITLFLYSGANHNLTPAWNTAISRTLSFYNKHLKK
ncbi:MAG: prolyl oligopeptidase family serine peptidase [Candidatus Blackburnbacteria bacterium]|nr:prolyl oligopeptidase family serine peptidase [Candidatus Blackburnbacteria bacterium]